jgi:hypothetical protein
MVSVDLAAFAPGVTGFCEKVQVVFAGRPLHASEVAELKPFEGLTEMVVVRVPPAPDTVPEAGLRLTANEGVAEAVTVSAITAEADAEKLESPP